jgi:peptide/nickel transport system substrate-binding protein
VLGRLGLSFVGVAAGAAVLAGPDVVPATISGGDGGRASAPSRGGTLRVGRALDFDSLDPALGYLPDTWTLEYATCAKLYNYPDKPAPAGAIPLPEIARSLPRSSKDGRTNTIALRRTYRFHTGLRIKAANFVAAFNRDASPQLKSPGAQYLREIVGADSVLAGRAARISGVKTLGPYTLQIRTTRPLPDLVHRLALPFFCPIATNTPLREIDDAPGSGPYYVASHVPNRQVILKRNRYYGGHRPANVDEIVWTLGVGGETCRVAVEQNQIDYCGGGGVPAADYAELARRHGINREGGRFFFRPELTTNYFAFNHDRRAFAGLDQIPLKQAINWAIDRHALARAGGYLGARRTDQILPPGIGRAVQIYPIRAVTQANVARARALLAKARVKPTKLVLYTANAPGVVSQAQIFQFNVKRIGIDLDIRYFAADELFARLGTRGEPFDIAWAGWTADYPDGRTFFALLDGRNIRNAENQNVSYFDRPRYNRRIAAIERLRGGARRKAWADLDAEMMRDDPPWAPFSNATRRDFVSKSFGCYVFQPALSRVDLVAACKK